MDPRLEITDKQRAVAPGLTAETPPATILWRAMRAEHQRRAKERQQAEAESKRVRDVLASMADEVHRLRRTLGSVQATLDEAGKQGEAQQLQSIGRQFEAALSELHVVILAPEGEPYTGDLMELLDNVAQQPMPEIKVPIVAEVIKPAIIYRGALLRMGKAVIAAPAGKEEAETEAAGSEPVAIKEE